MTLTTTPANWFLADRTVPLMLQCCVCLSSVCDVTYCG